MGYIVFKRFRGQGIGGRFNLPYGTKVEERGGFLVAGGRIICAVTSENGWEHFRPDTAEGAWRQELLERLYRYYAKNGTGDDLPPRKGDTNTYWKNRLRTSSTAEIERLYQKRIGTLPGKESTCIGS